MKQLVFIALLCLVRPAVSQGQCVIYACDNTGAFGAGFNNDNAPTTFDECKMVAIRECKSKGGTNCTLLYQSAKAGWWAIINGKKKDGRNFFQGSDGNSSKSAAEKSVRDKYRSEGGADADNIHVYSWYAYSNVK